MRATRCRFGGWLGGLLASLVCVSASFAQQQYPTPMIGSLSPPGAKAGATVEVTLNGDYLEGVKTLHFSRPGIKAVRLPDPPPADPKKKQPAPPPKFKVTLPADIPVGILDVRTVGKWGVSNPRAFVVGNLDEAMEKEPNNDVPQAQKVALDTVVNGVINPGADVDYFVFTGKKGQRVLAHCAAFTIDSRMTPELRLYGAGGRELAANRNYRGRDALLDCTLPADGDYRLRVCQFTHLNGGSDYFYRLKISLAPWIDAAYPPVVQRGAATEVTLYGRNLPGGKLTTETDEDGLPLETLKVKISPSASDDDGRTNFSGTLMPRCGSINGFEYRIKNEHGLSNPVLLTFIDGPAILESGDNDEKAQEVSTPCDVCGRIEVREDRDCFAFSAKKGDVFIIEGYADRIGSPADLYFKLRRVDNKQVLGEFDDHPAIPPRADRFFTYSTDPQTRFTAPADGKYEVMVTGRVANVRAGARQVYRLSIRKERHDFDLVVVGNNDGDASGCTVRQGASQDFQVICLRHDGFDGQVALTIEGLPAGVTCPPQQISGKQADTVLVVTAASGAADWAGPVTIKGTATVDGKKVERVARAGCLVWPSPNNQPGVSRLARSLWLAVRAKGPYSLDALVKELEAPVGGSVALKLKVNKQLPDFKGNVQVRRHTAPVRRNRQLVGVRTINIAAGKEGEVKFNLPGDTEPGTYNLVFQGQGQYPIVNPDNGRKQNRRVVTVSDPVRLTVYNTVAEVSVDKPSLSLKAGGEVALTVRVKRLHGYKGTFKVELELPRGFGGVSAKDVTIAAGANEAKLMLKVSDNAKPASTSDLAVRATARVGNTNLQQDAKLKLSIVK